MESEKRTFHHQESLIAKAKAEYVKKTMPRDKMGADGSGECRAANCPSPEGLDRLNGRNFWRLNADLSSGAAISDPNDPKFDLEAYLKMVETQK